MDDLFARIMRQNAEKDAEVAARVDARPSGRVVQPRPEQPCVEAPSSAELLTEQALQAQDRELDRELQLERQRSGHNVATRPTGKPRLVHPSVGKENARAAIPLLPKAQQGSVAGSVRGPPTRAGSVAGSVTPSERLRRPVHFTHGMVRDSATSQMDVSAAEGPNTSP